jgi:hypothetical protein
MSYADKLPLRHRPAPICSFTRGVEALICTSATAVPKSRLQVGITRDGARRSPLFLFDLLSGCLRVDVDPVFLLAGTDIG